MPAGMLRSVGVFSFKSVDTGRKYVANVRLVTGNTRGQRGTTYQVSQSLCLDYEVDSGSLQLLVHPIAMVWPAEKIFQLERTA